MLFVNRCHGPISNAVHKTEACFPLDLALSKVSLGFIMNISVSSVTTENLELDLGFYKDIYHLYEMG